MMTHHMATVTLIGEVSLIIHPIFLAMISMSKKLWVLLESNKIDMLLFLDSPLSLMVLGTSVPYKALRLIASSITSSSCRSKVVSSHRASPGSSAF